MMVERRNCGSFKDLLDAVASPCRTLDVRVKAAERRHPFTLLRRHRLGVGPRKMIHHVRVGPQVQLCADEDNGHLGTEVRDFRQPLVDDVRQAVRIGDTEADQ